MKTTSGGIVDENKRSRKNYGNNKEKYKVL